MSQPRLSHFQATTSVLRYLKFVPVTGILFYASSSLRLLGFADSNWARFPDTRKYVTGYYVMLASSLLCWKSKKQHTVSRSSMTTEYRALTPITCEIQWLQYLLILLMYFVTSNQLFTWHTIPLFTNATNTLSWTVILCLRSFSLSALICFLFQLMFNWLTC